MEKISFKSISKSALSIADTDSLGYSLLEGKVGDIKDLANGEKPQMKRLGKFDENAIAVCTLNSERTNHIDIMCNSAALTYDLGKICKVEKAVITCYYNSDTNYSLGEFKLYAANDREALYDDCNEVAYECGKNYWKTGGRNNSDWLYEVCGSFRFFGIKFIEANPTDDIIRLDFVGLYNTEHNENVSFYKSSFPMSVLSGSDPKPLTDGVVFENDDTVAVEGEQAFEFCVNDYSSLTDAWVIASSGLEISIDGFGEASRAALKADRTLYRFGGAAAVKGGKLCVKVTGNGFVDQIGAFSENRTVEVDFNDIICDDFLGVGANVLPMSFMPEAIANGNNEVYWALERERILKAKPNVVRMWFQPDWLCEDYESYKSFNYDFETQKMHSVYRYLDAFKECGTEVEFNFGWKVARNIQSWFSLPTANPTNSAPKELDLFAKCCAKTLTELINNRGYNNIKNLAFYNEPDGGNYTTAGDFSYGDGLDKRPYWAEMVKLAAAELKKCGLDYLEIWGCEGGNPAIGSPTDWIDYMHDHADGILARHAMHQYSIAHKDVKKTCDNWLNAKGRKPVLFSECGQSFDFITGHSMGNWNMNECQLFQDITACGVCGVLIWVLNGMDITDPCSFTMCDQIDFWDAVYLNGGIENVRENYYRWAYLSHYVPNHSQSVKTKITNGGENNIRACAFKFGDDYTVVLELNNEIVGNRDIEIKLGKSINKKFYKHVYRTPCKRDGNATLPPAEKEIFADDKIRDTASSNYQQIVYTTLPPVTQVELSQNEVFLTAGQKYMLSGKVIDGSGDIAFELAAEIGDSAVFDANNRTASFGENAKSGDMFAVKAYSVNNPKATSVVIFKYSEV